MELIEVTQEGYFKQCDECESLNKKVVEINQPDFYGNQKLCEKCIVDAYKLIRLNKFDKEEVTDILEHIVNERLEKGGNVSKEFMNFIEFVKPFLIEDM